MNKEKNQAKNAQGAEVANEEKTAIVKAINEAKTETTSKSIPELEAEISQLKKKLISQPESLEEKILYFQQKKEWIKHLDKLTHSRDQLLSAVKFVEDELEENEFISPNFSIRVTKKPQYGSEEDVFRLNNPAIIKELIEFVSAKIELKRAELIISIEN